MPDKSWRPDRLDELEREWGSVDVPSDLTAQEAEQLMLHFLRMRERWLDAYANAVYWEDLCNWQHDAEYNTHYLWAEAKSAKDRETMAKNEAPVKTAKLAVIEAHAATVRAKLKLDSSVLAHHAVKRIFEEMSQDKRYL